ncbi:hypothetical protein BC830DRAFT_44259 [Chytriomyces sp. MP71]|nr:hypothetical protein BC830DRAFT_44259 [Chytriomyces sp. MP71]
MPDAEQVSAEVASHAVGGRRGGRQRGSRARHHRRTVFGVRWLPWFLAEKKAEMLVALEVQAPWSRLLLAGTKTVETRRYPLPSHLVGQRLWMLETPAGAIGVSALASHVALSDAPLGPRITGSFVVTACVQYGSYADWTADRHRHCVQPDVDAVLQLTDPSRDWNSTPLFGWVVANPATEELILPNDVILSRVYRSLFTLSLSIPTVRLNLDSHEIPSAVLEAVAKQCRHVGFLRVSLAGEHDAARIVESAHDATRDFFSLPDPVKEAASKSRIEKTNESFCSTGYRGAEQGANNTGGRESFSVVRPDYDGLSCDSYFASARGRKKFSVHPDPQVPWPSSTHVPTFQSMITAYYALMQKLSAPLFHLFARLLDLPHRDTLHALARRHTSSLMLSNHRPGFAGRRVLTPHADITCFTVLSHDARADASGSDCLEVANPYYGRDARLGRWIRLAPPAAPVSGQPEAPFFLVNVGQVMERWSGGRLLATLHRVVRNRGEFPQVGPAPRRQALVYFQNVDYDTVLKVLQDGPPVNGANFEEDEMAEYEAKRMASFYDGSDEMTVFNTYNQDVLYRLKDVVSLFQ